MEYRVLGKTGLKVSRMGFGGIPIQKTDAEGAKKVITKLTENGVNFIDTARGYTVLPLCFTLFSQKEPH